MNDFFQYCSTKYHVTDCQYYSTSAPYISALAVPTTASGALDHWKGLSECLIPAAAAAGSCAPYISALAARIPPTAASGALGRWKGLSECLPWR